jgi:hypothetical protein
VGSWLETFEDESPVYLLWIVKFVINISYERAASVSKGILLLYGVITDKATAKEFVMKTSNTISVTVAFRIHSTNENRIIINMRFHAYIALIDLLQGLWRLRCSVSISQYSHCCYYTLSRFQECLIVLVNPDCF